MSLRVVHEAAPAVPRDRLVRLPLVEEMTGCKKSTLYGLMKQGQFPKPVPLGGRMVAWSENAVLSWVQDRIAVARAGSAA